MADLSSEKMTNLKDSQTSVGEPISFISVSFVYYSMGLPEQAAGETAACSESLIPHHTWRKHNYTHTQLHEKQCDKKIEVKPFALKPFFDLLVGIGYRQQPPSDIGKIWTKSNCWSGDDKLKTKNINMHFAVEPVTDNVWSMNWKKKSNIPVGNALPPAYQSPHWSMPCKCAELQNTLTCW